MTEGSKGVALTNWMVQKASGFLERRTSRRGFLVGSAMVGSAVAVTGCQIATQPGTPYKHITDCGPSFCTDGYTEFCCAVNNGVNACPPDSFAGGWWRADYSSFCSGTRYYIDCMQYCCGPATGFQSFCAGCSECRCAGDCNTRRVYCNYFRYGQCHQEIVSSGPIACRVVTCVPPYTVADWACSTAAAVDNSTAEHAGNCPAVVPAPAAVLASTGEAVVGTTGAVEPYVRARDGGAWYRAFENGSWAGWAPLGGLLVSRVRAVNHANQVFVFARAMDNALWTRIRTGDSWSAWQFLDGTLNSDPAAASTFVGLYVFSRAADRAIWYRRHDAAGWGPWTSLGGTLSSNPIVATGPDGLFLVARADDFGYWYRRFDGASWSNWQSVGGIFASDPGVAAGNDGVFVFGRGADSAIHYKRYTGGTWTSDYQSLGGTITSDPVAIADDTGTYVFARAADNALWYRRFTGGSWQPWTWLDGNLVADPIALSTPSGLYVFAVAAGNGLWYRRFAGGVWEPWQPLEGSLAPIKGAV